MVKKIISVATAFLMLCCMIPFAAFADDVLDICPKCGERTYETWTDFSTEVPDLGFPLSAKRRICRSCGYAYYDWNCLGFTGYKEFDNSSGSFFIDYIKDWKNKTLGKNATAKKMDSTNGGANIPAAGGRNPKGYGDEGKANVNQSGAEILWAEPFGVSNWPSTGFYNSPPDNLCAGSSGFGPSYSSTSSSFISPVYYFIAPVTGLYYVGSGGSPYDFGSFNYFYNKKWKRIDYITSYTEPYFSSRTLNKGDKCYFIKDWHEAISNGCAFKFYLNKIPIFIEPLGDSGVINQNKITINNNTWNGNIYVDNSNNLTYIYPQYTTVNEKNETVTNISNTPIIYNNETYQYYTYDQTTKNYYYITYPNQPTPPPTATPSPTPDPNTEHPVRDMYYRWVLTERRGTDDGGYNAIQVSELVFYDEDKNVISWPSDVTIKSSLDTSWNEPIANLVDNNTKNKWGCNKWGSSAAGNCVIDIFAPNMQVPSYYGYVTGSDMPARDPVSWKLYYSFDGLKYYEASSMERATDIPTDRNAKTEKWPFNYQSPIPSPSPTPAPTEKPGGSISTPETGKPGGDTGDTTGILAVLVEIRDNMIQGFLDIKAAFVAGFAEFSANFTLAIENLNVNIQNIFNKKFPDQNTPETALPSPTPSPSPAPVEPILPANRFRIIPNMTSNTFNDSHGTWSAFGSSEYSSLYTYFRAFTVDSSYWWTSSQSKKSGSYDREMPCWLAIEIPDPENYYIDGYVLKGAGSGIYYDDWQFQYSDDGSAWTDLDSVSDGGLKDQKEHDFNVAVHKAHKYYRWYFTKAPVSWPGLGTANLYGYNAQDVVVPTPTPAPSPTPAPTDPPTPTTPPIPGGDKPGGSGSGSGSGDNSWNPFKWLTDLLKDLIEDILKGLWKLLTSIFGFILWLLSLLFKLFPWMPNSGILALCAGVVVVTVIRIIKFITGR